MSFVFLSQNSQASINYHGRIISQANNQPLTSSNVRFNIKIKAGSTCVVYEENHDNIDMTSSNGYFNLNIGEGSSVFGSLNNALKIDNSVVNCADSNTITMSPIISKSIDVQILEYSGFSYSTNIAQINGIQIQDVPVSFSARNLEGKTANQFIQVSGAVTQNSISDLITGASTLYVQSANLASDISPYLNLKLDKSSNLSDLTNVATARTNLGLGSLATQNSVTSGQVSGLGNLATLNSVSDSNITSLSYSKLINLPLSFTPSTHTHVISDVTGLQTALDAKLTASKLSLNCLASQTVQYISVSDSYQCQSISISNTQVSGLGTLATLNSVSDSNITSLSGTKLTGVLQVGTVGGASCSSAGLLRYNLGALEVCDGSIWVTPNTSNSYFFDVYKIGGNNNGTNSLIFSAITKDTANGFELANNGYRIKSSGDYFFVLEVEWTAAQAVPFTIRKNGTILKTYGNSASSFYSTIATTLSDLQVNDLITVTSATGTIIPITRAYFSGFKISSGGGSGTVTSTDIVTALGYTPVRPSNNLSDLSNVSTARTNLGLGSIATLNTITDTNITSLSGTKLTGGVQIGTVSGTTCTSAGLTRYNSGALEVCNGSTWLQLGSSPAVAAARGNPPAATSGNPFIFPTKFIDTSGSLYSTTTGKFTASSSGYYKLIMTTTGAPSTGLTVYLYINDVLQYPVGAINTSLIGQTFTAMFYLDANQTADFRPNATYDATDGNIFFEKTSGGSGSTSLTSADITTALNYTPQNAAKLSLNCTAAQTVQYVSVTDSYQCQSIAISDSNISSLAGSKLTGGVQIGTVAGTTCTSAGLTRYNSGNLEYCNGSSWILLSSYASSAVPILSGWTQFTLPITASTTNPTKGTVVTDKAYWRRVGDTMEIMYSYEQSAGGSAGSGTYIFPIPSGYTIDTAKSVAGIPQQGVVGHFSANGGAQFTQIWGEVKIHNTTGLSLHGSNEASRYIISSGSGDLGQSSIKYSFFASVPIVGWSATTNLTVNNPVVVIAQNSSGQSIVQNTQTIITNWTEIKDSSNSFNPTTGIFTAPTAGDYEIDALITFGDTIAIGDRIINIRNITNSFNVIENLRPYTSAGSGQISQPVSYILSLNQGDQVAITATHGATGNQSIVGVARRNTLTIKQIGF